MCEASHLLALCLQDSWFPPLLPRSSSALASYLSSPPKQDFLYSGTTATPAHALVFPSHSLLQLQLSNQLCDFLHWAVSFKETRPTAILDTASARGSAQ